MGKVIITGANGFIGSHIVKCFCNKGIAASCLVRKDSDLSFIKAFDVDLKYGDIRDQDSLNAAFKGHDFVIHNAAYVKDWGDYETFYQTNVEGTINVLKACVANGIKDMIVTGTNSIYGEENSLTIKDEDSPHNSYYRYFLDGIFPCKMNYYRDTKRIAVEKAMDFAKREGINLTILDPVWVYGENGKDTFFLEYIKSAKQGISVSPGSRRNRFHVVYAGDVAEAYYLVFRKRLKGVQSFIVGNHERERMDDILSVFCEFAGVKKPGLLPRWAVYPIGFLLEALFTLFNAKQAPLLTRARVNMFYDNIEYSTKRAEQVLGFKVKHALRDGVMKTVAWFKEQGLLK